MNVDGAWRVGTERGRQPANWATLVRVLRDAEFSVLAGDVEQVVPTLEEGGREGGGGEC